MTIEKSVVEWNGEILWFFWGEINGEVVGFLVYVFPRASKLRPKPS
jgi:hypothetical protein